MFFTYEFWGVIPDFPFSILVQVFILYLHSFRSFTIRLRLLALRWHLYFNYLESSGLLDLLSIFSRALVPASPFGEIYIIEVEVHFSVYLLLLLCPGNFGTLAALFFCKLYSTSNFSSVSFSLTSFALRFTFVTPFWCSWTNGFWGLAHSFFRFFRTISLSVFLFSPDVLVFLASFSSLAFLLRALFLLLSFYYWSFLFLLTLSFFSAPLLFGSFLFNSLILFYSFYFYRPRFFCLFLLCG